MKTLSLCHCRHAINVSDSYCSARRRPFVTPRLRKPTVQVPSRQDSVSCVYKSELVSSSSSREELLITLTWTRDLVRRGFDLELLDARSKRGSGCAYRLRKVKGYSSFDFDGSRIEVWWNLSAAEYDNGCEPGGQFYLMMAVDSELCLKLGNNFSADERVKKMETSPGLSKTVCFSRRERFSGSTFYSTKAKFCDSGKEHDIRIKCVKETDESGAERPLLLVLVDGRKMVRVANLEWNFRGNQTIFFEGLVVDVMWDVQEWFFNSGRDAVFLFRTRSGPDSRLWFEEKNLFGDQLEFSLVISGCKKHQAKSWV
uniref:DUF868 family protein n=1 Tax=Kalanchoe fedtschenkoi TaxID=63787 RepID=A0A7N0RHJ1_KALFE